MSKTKLNKKIGCELYTKRIDNGLPIRFVAKKTKIDPSKLSRIERGENRISLEDAVVLCEYYGISLVRLADHIKEKRNLSHVY